VTLLGQRLRRKEMSSFSHFHDRLISIKFSWREVKKKIKKKNRNYKKIGFVEKIWSNDRLVFSLN
jgi:hypothetical protein